MSHVVLLGDSIFDNASYVPGRPAVIEQVRELLPTNWRATLLAVDGHRAGDIASQLARLPADASHLFISVGGNDALAESAMLNKPARSVAEALDTLNEAQRRFALRYEDMLKSVSAINKPLALCTVYDSVPVLGPQERIALGVFNEVILRTAFNAGVAIIDLRIVCDEAVDYSHVSPIEPSEIGGSKIARRIVDVATGHDFAKRNSVVYR